MPSNGAGPAQRCASSLRPLVLLMVLAIVVHAGIGMVVNLFVVIPTHHPGARPTSYVAGSLRGVAWAIADGPVGLIVHATLGIAIIVQAVVVASVALRRGFDGVAMTLVVGALLPVGAGFNGASFLDFNEPVSSLLMALLAFGALAWDIVVLYLLPCRALAPPQHTPALLEEGPRRGGAP